MPVALSLLLLRYNPSFYPTIAEDFEKKTAILRRGKQSEGNQLRSTEIRNKNPQFQAQKVPYRPSSMLLCLFLLLLRYNPSFCQGF